MGIFVAVIDSESKWLDRVHGQVEAASPEDAAIAFMRQENAPIDHEQEVKVWQSEEYKSIKTALLDLESKKEQLARGMPREDQIEALVEYIDRAMSWGRSFPIAFDGRSYGVKSVEAEAEPVNSVVAHAFAKQFNQRSKGKK